MNYPKQLNAFSVTKVMGPKPLEAEVPFVKKNLRRYLKEKGPFSYDPFRRNSFALISRQRKLASLMYELANSGQPLGRLPNIELLQHAHKQFEGRHYRAFPVRPALRQIKDGLIVRVFCSLYTVEGNSFTFEIFQPSKTVHYSEEQIKFLASLYIETLLKDDFGDGLIRVWDFSAENKVRRADSYTFSRGDRISKQSLDAALTVYTTAYDELLQEGVPPEAYRSTPSYEDIQYDLWRGKP